MTVANRVCKGEVDKIMRIEDSTERNDRLKSLKESFYSFMKNSMYVNDAYGYKSLIKQTLMDILHDNLRLTCLDKNK